MRYIKNSIVVISIFFIFSGFINIKNLSAFTIYASIKPLYSLVSILTNSVSTPHLIYLGKPNEREKITQNTLANTLKPSDLVIMINQHYESDLFSFLKNLPNKPEVIEVAALPNVEVASYNNVSPILVNKSNNNISSTDYHIWLNPLNTKAILKELTEILVNKDPKHAKIYKTNLQKALKTINYSYDLFTRELKPYKNVGFLYYVNGYDYFGRSFGLTPKGVIIDSYAEDLSTEGVNDFWNEDNFLKIQAFINQNNISCVFLDAETPDKELIRYLNKQKIHYVKLDFLGSIYPPDWHLYFKLTANNFGAYKKCLSKK